MALYLGSKKMAGNIIPETSSNQPKILFNSEEGAQGDIGFNVKNNRVGRSFP